MELTNSYSDWLKNTLIPDILAGISKENYRII